MACEANCMGTGGGTEASPKRGHESWRVWGYSDIGGKCVNLGAGSLPLLYARGQKEAFFT